MSGISNVCLVVDPPQLHVSGNNLLNICKLVFQMSRNERNDGLFQENSIIGECSSTCLILDLAGNNANSGFILSLLLCLIKYYYVLDVFVGEISPIVSTNVFVYVCCTTTVLWPASEFPRLCF